VISTDHVSPGGWDGTAPQGCIVPPDLSVVSPPPWLMNYCSLPVIGNYPEPVAASKKETKVRHNVISILWVSIRIVS